MSRLFRWLLVFIWMAGIFSLSSGPVIVAPSLNLLDFVIKKSGHMFEYAVLYLLLFNALEHKAKAQTAFLIGLAYAFTDELHQLLVPGRTGMLRDVLTFDTIGLLLGALVAEKVVRWKKR